MIKTGKVMVGKTPSEMSGRPSETIKNGQALCKDEKPDRAEEAFLKALAKDAVLTENSEK